MLFTIENDRLTVQVSDTGAELQSIRGRDNTEYLWQGDPAFWGSRAPVLFPYTGRVLNGQYQMDGAVYSMGVHGFSRTHSFRVTASDQSRITLSYEDDEQTYAAYPRHFSFQVAYALNQNVLEVTYTVVNRDTKGMIFGLGAHPGFAVPLVPQKQYEEYRLRFSTSCTPRRILFDGGYRTGETAVYPLEDGRDIPLDTELFSNDALLLTNVPGEVTLETENDCHKVTVSSEFMPYVGFWKPYKAEAHFVCIEPWCTLPSLRGERTVFEEQADLIHLASGSEYRWDWKITID